MSITQHIIGEIDPKLTGKAYDEAIYNALKPEAIADYDDTNKNKESKEVSGK